MAKKPPPARRDTPTPSAPAPEVPPALPPELRDLFELMSKHDMEEVEIDHGDLRVRLKRRGSPMLPATPAYAPEYVTNPAPMLPPPVRTEPSHLGPSVRPEVKDVTPAGGAEKTLQIRSPMVGTFYSAPNPEAPAFVKVGDEVDAETVVCIIEAMKVMNEIKAEVAGTIAKVLVRNGESVDFDKPLFEVRPR